MTEFTSSTGVVRDVELDLDAICAYEESHPGWSLMDLMDSMKRLRFTDLDLMARFLGFAGYKAFVSDGFTMSMMADMVTGSKFLGFTDSTSGEE